MIQQPPFLKPGDTIAITCPSGYLPLEDTLDAQKMLQSWGFKVIVGETVGHEYHYFSGNDAMRLKELQGFLNDPKVNCILAGRGGYGLSRIIDQINFDQFIEHPKWVVGFSDITVLHAQIHNLCHVASIHGPMCRAFKDKTPGSSDIETLYSMLTGAPVHYVIDGDEHNRQGSGNGILVGGNLSILAHLVGSDSFPNTDNTLLFIEDVGEYIYGIDRMLLTLKRAGVFDNLAGLLVGQFTDIKDTTRPFGASIPEIIREKVAEYDYPVCFNVPAGHIEQNYPLILGGAYELTVDDQLSKLRSLDPSLLA